MKQKKMITGLVTAVGWSLGIRAIYDIIKFLILKIISFFKK